MEGRKESVVEDRRRTWPTIRRVSKYDIDYLEIWNPNFGPMTNAKTQVNSCYFLLIISWFIFGYANICVWKVLS